MKRLPSEEDAIAWYAQENSLIPQLSTHPTYRFMPRGGGDIIERQIGNLVSEHKKAKKEAKASEKAKSNKK